jgi:alpha-L-rhamnosidase
VVIRHAEVLDDKGELYIINLRTARATDTYIARGDEAGDWSPRFTYHGYRYAEISGLPEGVKADESTLISRVVHTDVEMAGTFESSNPLLGRIMEMTRWGLRSNLHSIPSDCPQRDERLGWTGDAQIIADTLDLLDSQFEDGLVPNVAPRTVTEGVSMAWADVITVLPWSLYRFFGRKEVLERAYPGIKKWLGYLDAHDEDGLTTVGTFGDWVPVEQTPPENVASAFAVWSPRLAAKIARVLGHDADAQAFEATAKRRASAYHEHFFDKAAGEYKPGTQTANVLPLAFDITPEPLREQVARKLVENVRAHGGRLTTGFIGSPVLLQTLSRFGYHEDAFGIIATDQYPSLGYMLSQNATTVWERWNTDKADPSMNSHNHYAYGALTAWLFERLAGINPTDEKPGFASVRFTPGPVKGLDHAAATYQSIRGPVECGWRREGNELIVDAEVPESVEATLHWPGSGTPQTEGGNVNSDNSTFTWTGGRRRFLGNA